MRPVLFSLMILSVLGLLFISCDERVAGPGVGQGKIVVYLTDAPGNYSEVNIQIDRVEVHSEEHGWRVVNTFDVEAGEGKYNLLELTNGVMEFIGEENLDAGWYTQVRLVLTDNNWLVLTDESEHHLFVPSGEQTGLKIPYEFEIIEGETRELLLDFDAYHSIVEAGQSGLWLLKPVIRVQLIDESGSLTGRVETTDGQPIEEARVRLYEEVEGEEKFVTSSRTDVNGMFKIVHVAPGDYIVEVEAAGYEKKRLEEKVTIEIDVTKDIGVIILEEAND
jgi:5-hydroxyisourate hydrolase-like protein (transthyretin family)